MPMTRDQFSCRLAEVDDTLIVCDLLKKMHAESVPGNLNWNKVAPHVDEIIHQGRCYLLLCDGEPCGTMAIEFYQPWWSDEFKCTDEWLFIDMEYRCLYAFQVLLDHVVERVWSLYKLPIRVNLNTKTDGDRKRELFRHYMEETMKAYECKYVGGTFVAAAE